MLLMKTCAASKHALRDRVTRMRKDPDAFAVQFLSMLNNAMIFSVPSLLFLCWNGLGESVARTESAIMQIARELVLSANFVVILACSASVALGPSTREFRRNRALSDQFNSLSGLKWCALVNFVTVPLFWIPVLVFRILRKQLRTPR